ncbi:MAG TPA: DNA polymerase III subunit beta [Phycisphaerae bacterium]|nr:DNA polymerase III subunit beta [Phycisphaerae bacterium]HRY67554.1 DNA polymerase III subunit beta [Phycisphaerae bacterium]HSA24941.1 DNA polymerase III subunit beta [Phycisphaerae bacterium]
MHAIVNRSGLVEVLNLATSVVASRTPKDILKSVRLTTTDDGLLISATDLEVGLRGVVRQVEVKSPGESLLPADKLMQIARESMDETLSIEDDGEKCHITGQDSIFDIYGHDPHEYPPVPDLEGPADLEIDSQVLHRLIERTVFSVAKENTRYAINGVLWEKRGRKLSLVATDGRRLAWATGSTERVNSDDDRKMIVPAKTVSVLQRVLGSIEQQVAVQFSDNQVVVAGAGYTVSSALVEGHFPPYEEVIPQDNDKRIELPTESFLSAVRRASLLANDQSKGVRLHFGDGKLVLSSRAPEQGEATVSMVVDYAGPPLEIGFNPVFLTEALRVAASPIVTAELKDGMRPGIFRVGGDFVYLVMPVSLV